MAVSTISGALVVLRSQVRSRAGALGSTDAKNRVTDAVDRFQNELAALGFPTTTGADNPSATSLSDALSGMRQQITAQSSLSTTRGSWP
jgi:hypothetical protein